MKKLVLFGAGKIGRSFIGQLFARSGYEVVFVDILESVINEINQRREYTVVIKSEQPDECIRVENVRGILASDPDKVSAEISDCDLVAVSVGQKGLPQVISLLADGLILRRQKYPRWPLDIILAENMRNADRFVNESLRVLLGEQFPVEQFVGLIETSIGKMVPIVPDEVQQKDLLLVYAEPYNTLILDKKVFKNPIPDVIGLAPKENMKAWVDRKSYLHNLGHAAAAYSGYMVAPSFKYLADMLALPVVRKFTRATMLQSAEILMRKYPNEFTAQDLVDHIDDLLHRFENQALGDTVFRVGSDLKRKLHRNDRILSTLIDGLQFRVPVNKLLQTYSYGLCFKARDEFQKLLPGDLEFTRALNKKGLFFVLTNFCGLNPISDGKVINRIMTSRWDTSSLKLTVNQVIASHSVGI